MYHYGEKIWIWEEYLKSAIQKMVVNNVLLLKKKPQKIPKKRIS